MDGSLFGELYLLLFCLLWLQFASNGSLIEHIASGKALYMCSLDTTVPPKYVISINRLSLSEHVESVFLD